MTLDNESLVRRVLNKIDTYIERFEHMEDVNEWLVSSVAGEVVAALKRQFAMMLLHLISRMIQMLFTAYHHVRYAMNSHMKMMTIKRVFDLQMWISSRKVKQIGVRNYTMAAAKRAWEKVVA